MILLSGSDTYTALPSRKHGLSNTKKQEIIAGSSRVSIAPIAGAVQESMDRMMLQNGVIVILCLLAILVLSGCNAAGVPSPTTLTNTTLIITSSTTGVPTTSTSTPGATNISTTTPTPGKISLGTLVGTADYIVVGKVAKIVDDYQDQGKVYTLVTFNVEQQPKGTTADEITIKIPGGTIGGIGVIATDYPVFRVGEKAVVFLKKDAEVFTVSGGYQGKLTIDENNMVGAATLADYLKSITVIIAKN
jgi:hypothetical protein